MLDFRNCQRSAVAFNDASNEQEMARGRLARVSMNYFYPLVSFRSILFSLDKVSLLRLLLGWSSVELGLDIDSLRLVLVVDLASVRRRRVLSVVSLAILFIIWPMFIEIDPLNTLRGLPHLRCCQLGWLCYGLCKLICGCLSFILSQ